MMRIWMRHSVSNILILLFYSITLPWKVSILECHNIFFSSSLQIWCHSSSFVDLALSHLFVLGPQERWSPRHWIVVLATATNPPRMLLLAAAATSWQTHSLLSLFSQAQYITSHATCCLVSLLLFLFSSTTVGPWLSGHQLSGYPYYLAAILQCILCIFHSFPNKVLLKTKTM